MEFTVSIDVMSSDGTITDDRLGVIFEAFRGEVVKLTLEDPYANIKVGPIEGDEVQIAPVDSSNVDSVGYDPAKQELHVIFRSSDKRYVYEGVDSDTYKEFVESDSPGRFISTVIKPNHGVR